VSVLLATPASQLSEAAGQQLAAFRAAGGEVAGATGSAAPRAAEGGLIVDGLLGYSGEGPPRGRHGELIEWANRQPAERVALDLPSGLDADIGAAAGAVLHADATLTLALPKRGLLTSSARPHVGELYLADIGVPHRLYREVLAADQPSVPAGLFARGDVVRPTIR
jgi:NAD(P)H-hydrate epimerase